MSSYIMMTFFSIAAMLQGWVKTGLLGIAFMLTMKFSPDTLQFVTNLF